MEKELIKMKYIRIADIAEDIENLNAIIELHQKTTKDQSMIRQYNCRRDEQIAELQALFSTLNLNIVQVERANKSNLSIINARIADKEKQLYAHKTKLERIASLLGDEINEISHLTL